jgi:uncharacterized membrane protein YjgN (DUF898 family)
MQLPGTSCKSCGTALGGQARPSVPPRPQAPRLVISHQTPAQSPPAGERTPPHAGTGPGQARRLSFHGAGGSLFGIHIVNIFLTIVTLGIYYFWGKVRLRSYLLSQTEFEGDRFGYHGTGKELLIGFLKAVLVFGVPLIILGIMPELLKGPAIRVLVGLLTYAIVMVLVPLAMVGARRYRLSRTSWREIRFSFRGRASDFVKLFVGGALLTGITFGLYYPLFETRRHGFMVSHSYFGNQTFRFDGNGRDLFGSFLLALLLFFPSLGLCWFWFLARKQRYFWEHTSIASARFRSTVTGGGLLRLNLGNLLLLVATLGLGWPWVMVRSVRFAFRYLTLDGPLDLAGIQQEAQAATATGEALAGFLDAGLDLGA